MIKKKKYQTKWNKIGVDRKTQRKLYEKARQRAKERLILAYKKPYKSFLKIESDKIYWDYKDSYELFGDTPSSNKTVKG